MKVDAELNYQEYGQFLFLLHFHLYNFSILVLSQPLMIILLLKHNALLLFPEHEISETLLRRPSETIYIKLRMVLCQNFYMFLIN